MTGYAPRRPLGDMIVELSDGLRAQAAGMRAASLELSLPVETLVERRAGELVLLSDVPRFRRRTAFDLPPGRLRLRLEALP